MKTYILRTIMLLVICISFSAAGAQIIVKVRPVAPVLKVRPARPSVTHVWVGGNYAWRGGQYYYTDGYWAAPPVPGNRWVEGRWKHRKGGWVWIPGHWR